MSDRSESVPDGGYFFFIGADAGADRRVQIDG